MLSSSTSRVLRSQDTLESHIGKDILESLNEYEIVAIQLAYSEKKVTRKRLSEHLRRSVKFASSTLHGLVDKGILEWHGSSPSDPHHRILTSTIRCICSIVSVTSRYFPVVLGRSLKISITVLLLR